MRRSLLFALAAACSLPVASLVASAAPTVKRKASKAFVAVPKVPRALTRVDRKLDPKLAAVAVSALRRFANDASDPTDVDLVVRKRLGPVKRARKIAKRLIDRFDRLSEKTRTKTFGGEGTKMRLTKTEIAKLAPAKVEKVSPWMMYRPSVALPAEGIETPSDLEFVVTGVSSTQARDSDGSDEVIVIVDRIMESAVDTVSFPAEGTTALAGGSGVAAGLTLFDESLSASATLVSAVFEDDNGSTATAREDYRVMIALAQGLAESLDDSTYAQRLDSALTTCVGLLEISNKQVFADGAVTWSSAPSVEDLYATSPSKTNGIEWKQRHDHQFGNGVYEVLFTVPSPPPPRLKTINVKIVSVEVFDDLEHEPKDEPKTAHDLGISVAIRDEAGFWEFPDNDNSPLAGFSFTREVLPGRVELEIEVWERGSTGDGCGYYWGSGSCTATEYVDIRPGAGTEAKLKYDPRTKTVTGAVSGAAGEQLTLKGDSTTKLKGKVVLVVSHE